MQPMRVHISEGTRECLLEYPQYKFEERGVVEIKVRDLAMEGKFHQICVHTYLVILSSYHEYGGY